MSTDLPPEPYSIINGQLCRDNKPICSVAFLLPSAQEFLLEISNIAYMVGFNKGEQRGVERAARAAIEAFGGAA